MECTNAVQRMVDNPDSTWPLIDSKENAIMVSGGSCDDASATRCPVRIVPMTPDYLASGNLRQFLEVEFLT